MSRRKPAVPLDAPGLTFLTAAEIPADTRGIRPGGWVRVARPRRVCRTGYRLRADDGALVEEAATLLQSPSGQDALAALNLLVGRPVADLRVMVGAEAWMVIAPNEDPGALREELRWILQRALVRTRHFGGSARGVWVMDVPAPTGPHRITGDPCLSSGTLCEVFSTRRCWAGWRYAPSGSLDDWELHRRPDLRWPGDPQRGPPTGVPCVLWGLPGRGGRVHPR